MIYFSVLNILLHTLWLNFLNSRLFTAEIMYIDKKWFLLLQRQCNFQYWADSWTTLKEENLNFCTDGLLFLTLVLKLKEGQQKWLFLNLNMNKSNLYTSTIFKLFSSKFMLRYCNWYHIYWTCRRTLLSCQNEVVSLVTWNTLRGGETLSQIAFIRTF